MNPWEVILEKHKPSSKHRDDAPALRACQLALQAGAKRTYAVGAVLLDPARIIVAEGHNKVFIDGFRSDLHAEMVTLNAFEDAQGDHMDLTAYTLVSSLEPCPMCATRLIMAGVGTVLYVSPDKEAGMVTRLQRLPQMLVNISKQLGQFWGEAECSPELRGIAFEIWNENRKQLDGRLAGADF